MTSEGPEAWMGRTETCTDNIDISHAKRVALALNEQAPGPGEALPLLWHWAMFITAQPYSVLGRDGHAGPGGFLPVAEGRNRMWAGGRLHFAQNLRIGVPSERRSTVSNVVEKTGRTGKLLFVTVQHEYFQDGVLCVSEEQDLVYREPTPPKLIGDQAAPAPEWSEAITPDPVMLFRYSAVTFNSHRIHYDEPYITQHEGYPGLVVHGPLIATFMSRACLHANPGREIESFSYRGLRPLIVSRTFQVSGRLDGEAGASLWAEQNGTLAHQASVQFKE
ncbi:itaconyl-CoA hydratase [Alcaligenaceae bacterium CGII-47]|nr:itaconyl-CoA hydratase [Alcaligenaceae bacterium CGII-47]